MSPLTSLHIAVTLYALGTLSVLAALYNRSKRLQQLALGLMAAGFISHTVWIGTVCARTDHPPLTNLPEIAAFLAWTIFAVELFLFVRYRVHAAAFVVYPLILMLMLITTVLREPFAPGDVALDSKLFVAHLLLSTLGLAVLLIGLAFTVLYHLQERALKTKKQGAFFEWIPSLQLCELLSYRAMAIGFAIYTLGIVAGILWSFRTTSGLFNPRAKEIGAVAAWLIFAFILQSHAAGSYRTSKTILLSLAAFFSIVVAIFGIQHV